ncbi:branched-chain amino acid ABC transporter permease [Actinomadura viridis]|uniref:Branched-chain amino acid transport system permease protein n=1 Tax=Actinomadura viridis TaxID=58110 RepID=A0A931DMM2_9ACTN|nr:branched-chain amino acid ABC transporter permease [Actinomadura viridis]MBG6090386.1 branched-chain amino acid transport system permease protein [Actinomadura viridis]
MKMSGSLLRSAQTPVLLIGLTALIALVGSVAGPTVTRVSIVALVSVVFVAGQSAFTGNSGVMSFGHVAFMAVGAYATAYLTIPVGLKTVLFPDLPGGLGFLAQAQAGFLPAVLLSGAAALVLGVVTAPVVARLSGLQSGIATLALLIIVYNVLNGWTAVTRGSSSMIGIPRNTTVGLALAFAALAIVVSWAYRRSRSGLQLQAAREDHWAAVASGVAVGRHRAIAWVISAFLCGVAGSLYAGFLMSFNVSAFFLSATFAFIVMIVLGGYLSLSGAVIGALVVSVLQEFLRRLQDGQFTGGSPLPAGVADLILAAVLLVVLVKAPLGLMGVREICLPSRARRARRGAGGSPGEKAPEEGARVPA